MKKIIIYSLAVLLLSGCSKTPEEKIENLYQDGIEQISEFKYKTADSTFTAIFEIDPASVLGLIGVSKVAESRLQYYDAINNYSMILAVSTDYEDAFIGLYNSYKNLGFYQEALESAVYYNKLWHSNTHTKYILGEAYKNINQIKRAKTYFEQAVMSGYEHKNAAQLKMATILVLQGLIDDANKEASEAFADKSDDPIFYDAAAEYFETVGLIDSSMYYNKKLFAYDNSDIHNAYTSFKRSLKNNYLSDARNIMRTLEDLDIEPLALEGFKLIYSLHTDDKSLIRIHGQNYKAYAPKSLTGTIYESRSRAEVFDKLSIEQDLNLIKTDLKRGKYSNEFGKFYYYAMLMLNVKYEKNPGTISQLEELNGIRINRKEYKLEYALTKHVIGLDEECYSNLRAIESGHQMNADWLIGIAEVWGNISVQKYNIAEELYQKALKVDKNYSPAFDSYLNLLTHINKNKEALALFAKYPQFEKNKFRALSKTKYYFLNKKYKKGLNQFKLYYPSASGNIVFVNELVKILKSDNRTDDINSLLAMVDETTQDAKVLLAQNAIYNKEYKKSIRLLDEAIAIEPNYPDANILKARAMYFAGDKKEAYDLFEKNLIKFNRNPRNLLYYSQILASEGIDFGKASNMARQATFEGYGTYEYVINLADIYYSMGRYDLCRGESRKALQVQYKNPYPYFRLGMACSKSDDQERWGEEAKINLNKAKKLGLSGELLQEANAALKKL